MSEKLKSLKGGGMNNLFKDALRELKETMAEQIEYHQILAKIQKAKFDSLVKEGFSDHQAIELTKSI